MGFGRASPESRPPRYPGDALSMIATETLLARTHPRRFASFGLDRLAYLRAGAGEDGVQRWTVHAADGRALASFPSRHEAEWVMTANALEIVSLQ